MDAEIEKNILYYDFLNFIQEISKNLNSIQRQTKTIVYQNYDFRLLKKNINKQIADIDKLLNK